jgi:hypothetical protein
MDVDALFTLPLAEFTAARNALIKQLKHANRDGDVDKVKALAKPSVSAWAVNQLYWAHRNEFDRLIAAGERLAQAHATKLGGKNADVQGPLAERRDSLSTLLRLAEKLLNDAGHNATPDMIRRIGTTLETLSTPSRVSDGPVAGRLTEDVGPLGFEALTALVPGAIKNTRKQTSAAPSLAAAKATLKAAEQTLRKSQTVAQAVMKELKEATARARATEKQHHQAQERLSGIRAAADAARQRLLEVEAEAENAAGTIRQAEHSLANARNELQRLKDSDKA